MRVCQTMPPFTALSANRTYFGFLLITTCANTYKLWLLGSYTGAPVTPKFGSRSWHDLSFRNGDVARSYGSNPPQSCQCQPHGPGNRSSSGVGTWVCTPRACVTGRTGLRVHV